MPFGISLICSANKKKYYIFCC